MQQFERQAEFFDDKVQDETQRATRERLAKLAAETVGVDKKQVLDLTLTQGEGNGGNKVGPDFKLAVKIGRQNVSVVFTFRQREYRFDHGGGKEWTGHSRHAHRAARRPGRPLHFLVLWREGVEGVRVLFISIGLSASTYRLIPSGGQREQILQDQAF